MRKPVSRIALAVWILGAILAVGDLAMSGAILFEQINAAATATFSLTTYRWISMVWPLFRGTLFMVGLFVGLGAVIELLHQIRRNSN